MAKSIGIKISHLIDDVDILSARLESLYDSIHQLESYTVAVELAEVVIDLSNIKSQLKSLRRDTI